MNEVYIAKYVNDPEGGFITISVHRTEKGARGAISRLIKEKIRPQEHKYLKRRHKDSQIKMYQHFYWMITKTNIQE